MNSANYAYDVFVSYRWVDPDQKWVRDQLVPALSAAGLKVCLDVEDFVPGRDLILEMTRAGKESRHALCVLSPAYFDGNRMVGFESLMVRRSDPSGITSRLIPFILRPATLPDWLRGLIPIDWTSPAGCSREWRKLLKVLGASTLSTPLPAPLTTDSVELMQADQLDQEGPITIVDVLKLSPKSGQGIGYEVVVRNDSHDATFVNATEFSGVMRVAYRGSDYAMNRVVFEVELASAVEQSSPESMKFRGLTYDQSSPDWAVVSDGTFEYEMNTGQGSKRWEYFFSTATNVRVPAHDQVGVRLLFKKQDRRKVQSESEGSLRGSCSFGVIESDHKVILRFESGRTLSLPIEEDFLKFIANWEETA